MSSIFLLVIVIINVIQTINLVNDLREVSDSLSKITNSAQYELQNEQKTTLIFQFYYSLLQSLNRTNKGRNKHERNNLCYR